MKDIDFVLNRQRIFFLSTTYIGNDTFSIYMYLFSINKKHKYFYFTLNFTIKPSVSKLKLSGNVKLPRKIQQNSYIINNNKKSHELWAVCPVFCRRKKLIWVWNNTRVSKRCSFWVNYSFNSLRSIFCRKCKNEGLQMKRQREGTDGESRGVRCYATGNETAECEGTSLRTHSCHKV